MIVACKRSTSSNRSGFWPDPADAQSQYKAFLARLQRQCNYVIVPRRYARALGWEVAGLALYLCSVAQVHAEPDGFIQATPAFVHTRAGLDGPAQERVLRRLER
jgi:hypothetical protein